MFLKYKEHAVFSTRDMDNLGWMYDKGKGVLENDKMAVDCYQKAAKKGDPNGQNHLGDMYRYGRGVAKDYKMALLWYEKASSQNHAEAQNSIGDLYQNVYHQLGVAAEWYQKAAEQGDSWGQQNLAYLYAHGLGGLPQDHDEAKRLSCLSATQGNKSAIQFLQQMEWECP